MKRIKVKITISESGQEILTVVEPLFVAIVADRFVIDDQRGPIKAPKAKEKSAP